MSRRLPKWIDAYLPFRGPCGCCGGADARHRLVDAIKGCVKAGDSIEATAADFRIPVEFVRRLVGARHAEDQPGVRV